MDSQHSIDERQIALQNMTFQRFALECYLPQVQRAKHSWDVDAHIIQTHLLPLMGERTVSGITKRDLIDVQRRLQATGLASRTCNRIFSCLKTIFTMAEQENIIDATHNPRRNLDSLPEEKLSERVLTEEEIKDVFAELDAIDSLSAYALKLMILAGACRSEILCTRWQDIDLQRKEFHIWKIQGVKTITLSQDAVDTIIDISQDTDSPWLFPASTASGHLQSMPLGIIVRKNLGIEEVRIQNFRRAFSVYAPSPQVVKPQKKAAAALTTTSPASISTPVALSRLEKLLIRMRRHDTSFEQIAKGMGITRMSICRLCKAERIPPEPF